MNGDNFAFLVCSERSGSNLLTTVLNGHPEITAPPPSHLFRLFANNAQNYGSLLRDHNWHILLRDVLRAFDHQLGSWNTSLDFASLVARDLERSVVAPILELYRTEAAYDGASMMFVKENHTARFAGFLQQHLPGCRFVFMVRDPRDVAASYLATDGIPGGVERAVDVWIADQTDNLALWQLSSEQTLYHLRYEDLLADAQGSLAPVTSFLGLNYSSTMLDFHGDDRTRRNAQRIDAWKNLSRPIQSQNAGKYRQSLMPAEIEYIELRCHFLMQAFGYSPDIVIKQPDDPEIVRRCALLQPELREGNYRIGTAAEIEIRKRRLAMIDTVKARRLV